MMGMGYGMGMSMGMGMGMFPGGMQSFSYPYDSSHDYLKSPQKMKFHENPIRFDLSNHKIRPQEVSAFNKSGGETPMFMPNKIYNMVFQGEK